EEAGYEAFIVGGCVRDFLMGVPPKDYDITTSALPEETKAVFRDYHVIETGIRHGTVTVMMDGNPLEITTYRTEGTYSDNRHPDSVSFTASLREDVARRDFTMNAIAYSPTRGWIDHFGGAKDIQHGIIRCVGDPTTRFQEDALRMMRGIRFASVLGFEIEKETALAAEELIGRVDLVSRERCFVELKKALCGMSAEETLLKYPTIYASVVPELAPMIGFDQKNPHHCHDLLTHTAIAVGQTAADPIMRLSALFHDTGKVLTQRFDEQRVAHYYGHAAVSAELAEKRLVALKSDNYTREEVHFLVKHHDAPAETDKEQVAKKLRKYGRERYERLLALRRADNLAQSEEYHRKDLHDRCYIWMEEVLTEDRCFQLKDLAVNGRDLLALGYPRGPIIGEKLEELFSLVFEGKIANEREILLSYLKDRKL
ncbi:MAG: HD domain-containing protein, partial [Clostridia bacterium]|nr:HD domain-containing protein [Clostridia bacterium]